jgi:hypothetical protein
MAVGKNKKQTYQCSFVATTRIGFPKFGLRHDVSEREREGGVWRTIKKIWHSTCATHQGTAKTLHAMQKHFTQHNIGQTYGIKNVNPPSSNKDHTSTVPDSSGSSHRTLFKLRQTMQPNLILKATCNVWT